MTQDDFINCADPVINSLNIDNLADGVYEIIVCNVSKDYETGIIDDWDLKLIPLKED